MRTTPRGRPEGTVHTRFEASRAWHADRAEALASSRRGNGRYSPPRHAGAAASPEPDVKQLLERHGLKPQCYSDYGEVRAPAATAPIGSSYRSAARTTYYSPKRGQIDRAAARIQARHRGRSSRRKLSAAKPSAIEAAQEATLEAARRGFRDDDARARGDQRSRDYVAFLQAAASEEMPDLNDFKFQFDEKAAKAAMAERVAAEAHQAADLAARRAKAIDRSRPEPPGLSAVCAPQPTDIRTPRPRALELSQPLA